MTNAALPLLLMLGLQVPGPQKPPAKSGDKCTIEGAVLKASTGEPLRKAVVTARKATEGREVPQGATTDAGGRFVLKDIDPGRYYLDVSRNGYVDAQYGQRAPHAPGTILTLSPGQHLQDVSVRLIQGAVIAGHVYDEDGEPVAEAEVQALRYVYEKGQKKLEPSSGQLTNDRGEFRIYGLAPGEYYVRASFNPARFGMPAADGGYAPIYYPGTSDPTRAAPLAFRAGDEFPGVDFTLQPVRTVAVKGRVFNAITGLPGVNSNVVLLPRDSSTFGWMEQNQAFVRDPQGAFAIRGVRPGSYNLMAFTEQEGKQLSAREPIEVGNADLEGLTVTLDRGATLRGRVRIEGKAELSLGALNVFLQPKEETIYWGGASSSLRQDGSFEISQVGDGDYRVQLWELPEDVYLKSAQLAGEDALDSGLGISRKQAPGLLELVLSANGGRIDGVAMKDQQPFSGARVVLIPDLSRRAQERLYKETNTDQYGRFTLRGISPGDYKLFAWESVEEGAYRNPDFLRSYEDRGQAVHIDEGSRLAQQLQLIPAGEAAP